MTPEEYFSKHTSHVLRTESPHFCFPSIAEQRLLHAVLGLSDEIGELAKAMKARFFYGASLDIVNVKEEL